MNDVLTTGPVRIHQDANGDAHAVADIPAPSFGGAFRVTRVGIMRVRVGLGTLEGRFPTINQQPINARRVPSLELTQGPNEELMSWVCLRATVNLEMGAIDPDDPQAIQIVHVNDYALISDNGLVPDDGNGNGHKALALVVWMDKTRIRQIVQNTRWNQRHSFVPAAAGAVGHHLFRPDV